MMRGFCRSRVAKGAHMPRPSERRNAPVAALVALLLLSGCGLFKPSAEQRYRRGQGLITKAALICPECFQPRTDTLSVTLPGDSASGGSSTAPLNTDSLLADCAQLAEALSAERELYAVANNITAGMLMRRERTIDSLQQAVARRPVITQRMRERLCAWPPVTDSTALYSLKYWWTPEGPRHTLRLFARRATTAHTTTPVVHGPVVMTNSTGWWPALALLGWLLAVAATLLFISERAARKRQLPPQ